MRVRATFITLVVTVIFTTEVSSFDIPSNSCYLALHKYLADITPIFNTTDKSLAFDIGEPTLEDVKVNPIGKDFGEKSKKISPISLPSFALHP